MKTIASSCLSGAVLLGCLTRAALAQTAPTPPSIIVQGQGEVRVRPDIARLNLGVQTQSKSVSVATSRNAVRAQAIIAAIRRVGIAPRDIQTSDLSIYPQYDEIKGRTVFEGYNVSNEVRVVVRRVAEAGKVLDAAVRAGANTANGIAFDLNDRDAANKEALRRAVANAATKARTLAEAAGVGAIRLQTLQEGTPDSSTPRVYAMNAATISSNFAPPTPVSAGQIIVSATVTATYTFGSAR